jgi:hypothetical protein
MGQHALDHATMQSRGSPDRIDITGLPADLERHTEGCEGRFGKAGADQERLQAGAAAILQQRRHAGQRQAGQFGQRGFEQLDIA